MGPEKQRQEAIKIPGFVLELKEFYFKDEPNSIKEAEHFVNYTGDQHYVNPIQMCIERQMQKSTATYVYVFLYYPETSLFAMFYTHINNRGR